MTEYAERDLEGLGEHYERHVNAMTEEQLHSKSAIAAELAWRDQTIKQLQNERTAWKAAYEGLLGALTELVDGFRPEFREVSSDG